MTEQNYDVVIVGAGTAGLAAERSARRAGARTLLVDEQFAGTTCALVGCMPSKLLIAASKAARHVAEASAFGIEAGSVTIDGAAVLGRVRALRDDFVSSTRTSIEELPEHVKLRGRARFNDGGVLEVNGEKCDAKAIVIATGSKSVIPKTFAGLRNVLTNETVFDLETLPQSLAVIGAGPLGLELAQAFARLGVDVEVFDEGETVSGLKDPAVSRMLHGLLGKELPVRLKVSVEAAEHGDQIEISWSGRSSGKRSFTHVLVAAGRQPNLRMLGLEHTPLQFDDHGMPVFERATMQCGQTSIFLAGDCDADVPVLHEASAEGAIAGHNAATYPSVRPSKRSTPLAITFTDPPSASIGVPAREGDIVGEVDYSDQGRAKLENRNAGLARLYADKDGRLTGAEMASPEAEHMAHLIAWAIESGQTAMQLLDLPIYHPTFEEGLRKALRQICEKAGLPFSADRDQGSAPGA